MIRLSWRQFRTQAALVAALLVAVAVMFVLTRPHLAHVYGIYARAEAACRASTTCQSVNVNLDEFDRLLELVGTALVALPGLIGAFWGAPLVAREFEAGTHRMVWTQSVVRTRWLAVKLAVVGAASVVTTGLLSLLVTWWSQPIDRAHRDRFGSGLFGERNIVPLGYAAFGFALGVLAGIILRRTLPAMATTMVAYLAVRLTFTYAIRPSLLTPQHKTLALDANGLGYGSTNSGPASLMANPPDIPNAWIYSDHIVNDTGHRLAASLVASTCPDVGQPPSGLPAPGSSVRTFVPIGAKSALDECAAKIGASYHQVVTYQPADRYWPLQGIETAIFLLAAFVVLAAGFWWLRNRSR